MARNILIASSTMSIASWVLGAGPEEVPLRGRTGIPQAKSDCCLQNDE